MDKITHIFNFPQSPYQGVQGVKSMKGIGLCLSALILCTSCTDLTFFGETGLQPDPEAWAREQSVSLKTKQYRDNVVTLTLTNEYGITSAGLDLLLRSNRPAGTRISADIHVDETLISEYWEATGRWCKLLPQAFYRFRNGTYISLPEGSRESSPYGLTVWARNELGASLSPGNYLLPLKVSSSRTLAEDVVFVEIEVPSVYKDPDDVRLYSGRDIFTVFYINTSVFDPRLANDMVLMYGDGTPERPAPRVGIGNIVNLRIASVDYDETTSEVSILPSTDLLYVLDHYAERVAPVQESGRKVCICIEGGGKGVGFCNFNDAQIDEFVAAAKRLVDTYRLDGINLWDRNTGYGREGTPSVNNTSYPKLIKKLREALGSGKLITLVDYEEPTADFHDPSLTGGIAVGDYIDYAWHGYYDQLNPVQVVDPWHPEFVDDITGVGELNPDGKTATEYRRKAIAGLDRSKYGCIHASPRKYDGSVDFGGSGYSNTVVGMVKWAGEGLYNGITVFSDLRSVIQDQFEGNMQYPSDIISLVYNSGYSPDLARLMNENGHSGTWYNKWTKDW